MQYIGWHLKKVVGGWYGKKSVYQLDIPESGFLPNDMLPHTHKKLYKAIDNVAYIRHGIANQEAQ